MIVINSLADAHAAIDAARAANQKIDLISAPAASDYIGSAMFKTIADEARQYGGDCVGNIYYDCGANRGHVLAALRAGLKQICMDEAGLTPALMDIATRYGATVITRLA